MEPIRHDLRLSETVSPFGVGSIVDISGESLMAPDTSWWDKRYSPEIHCARLLDRIGSGTLRQAPSHSGRASKETAALTYWRFPAWRYCERCGRVTKFTGRNKGKWSNSCSDCAGALIPLRYVAVCEFGSHIQDIPWFTWTHRGHDDDVTDEVRHCRAYKELRLVRSSDAGEGLKSLILRCNGCKRSRSLADLIGSDSLGNDGIKCLGSQPWTHGDSASRCEHKLIATPRGATGNYIAERLSALDIPEAKPASEETKDNIRRHDLFSRLLADNGGPQAEMIAGWIADELGIDSSVVFGLANDDDETTSSPLLDLKDGEWAAFLKKLNGGKDGSFSDFIVDGWRTTVADDRYEALTSRLTDIGQVHRVREVRALLGFRRFSAEAALVPSDMSLDRRANLTFPAIEMFGEGIFLRFDEGQLSEWENIPEVRRRSNILAARRADTLWANRLDVPEPRYVALHTLSHLLMRRLAFDSGYASASLQERIYANSDRADRTAGILIYTAAGDAQGTLGGLARLGAPDKLLPLIVAALDEADVCSNDPVCIESDRQGSSHLNLSACHGCSLVSETSCETGNRLLDRQLLIGGSSVPGLLEGVVPAMRTRAQSPEF